MIPGNSSFEHKIVSRISLTSRTGLTMKSNEISGPAQPLKVGTMEIVAVSI